MLIEGDWSLDPGSENPDRCLKQTLERDIYVSAIRPVHPPGTHHTFLVLSDTLGSEGCTGAIASGTMLYAAAVGSEGLSLPEGVAMKLPAGKVLNLSLHVYNPSATPLSGRSGIEIETLDAEDVTAEMAAMISGPIGFELPAQSRTKVRHVCTLSEPLTLFALFPHMHQLGIHSKVSVIAGGTESVLHDAAFDFAEQFQLPMDSLELAAGDQVVTECTFENAGPTPVEFGESSDDEMCISMLFHYPAGPTLCVGETTISAVE